MRVVVAGQPKSGTTALYYRILTSVPDDAVGLFEPDRFVPASVNPATPWVIAKVLIGRVHPRLDRVGDSAYCFDVDSFSRFDRKLHIVRDPRDNLVSSFLYSVRHTSFYRDDRRLARFLQLLHDKERQPRAVSLCSLLDLMTELDRGVALLPSFVRRQGLVARFVVEHPEFYRVAYTDLVDDRVADIESYLGFGLGTRERVQAHSRVERTLAYGDWRNWFTPEDVSVLCPVLGEYVELAGFDDDWELADNPHIPEAFASGYVRRIVNERRGKDRGRWQRRMSALPGRIRLRAQGRKGTT